MVMNELARALQAIEHRLNTRVEVYRAILALDRTVIARIYRGSFVSPRSYTNQGEPQYALPIPTRQR
jgi:hypothetical protein